MIGVGFDREEMARYYSGRHLHADEGIRSIYYLPRDAPDREIRLLEVNDLIAERDACPLEPIDFGVDVGSENSHALLVLDVTPAQWEDIRSDRLALPPGWTLEGSIQLHG